ncbi:hypothetical protein SMACR_04877 [Sordaria macrospora]|uniref:WGS project CABT00000000 data, contig 2.1 n=2 Tax=Sordaria macrospora TaxID=5147 RepID=F7VLV6_SORMK|nr:uncharacterized protein SMAC_04877 [Sordaria macrospora k-hell]KAA8634334.1 hypothetical protein SMACR_04877 [Sordaria macrospora]WPJ59452.1 hypothetical protein SMAC4_04877 [Sordaria macrospora]CCC06484.1 unnamed protein product [Sordaria macrospora k-hell]
MGRKNRNPAWREANIWEKPEPARRYSTWATTTWRTSTWGSDHADPDPDPEAHIQPEEQQEEEEDGEEKVTKKKKKKPSIWRSLACGMKTALACDMFKPAFPWIAHLRCHFLAFNVSSTTQERGTGGKGGPSTPPMFRLFDWTLSPRGNIRQDALIWYLGWR